MFHYFMLSIICGGGFVTGCILTLIICTVVPRKLSNINTELNRESLQELRIRNAQWRPSQLDYFAAHIAAGREALEDGRTFPKGPSLENNYTPNTPEEIEAWQQEIRETDAHHIFLMARAMVIESTEHRDFLPPVPDNV